MTLLGIDIGTSGARAVLYHDTGKIIALASQEYPLNQPRYGWAEQDPEIWWQSVCCTCRSVLKQSNIEPGEISGIGLTGQMHGLVMLDRHGQVIRPAILWCDTRSTLECRELTEIVTFDSLMRITGNPALPGFTASKIQWIKKHEPDAFSACRHILLPKDYIRFRLSGVMATDVSDASGMQILDVPNRRWSDAMIETLQISIHMLGEVFESVELTGSVHHQGAKMTGLAEHTPIVAGAGDNAAAAVGMGVVQDGHAFTTIGSSGVVYAHTRQLTIDPMGRVHAFCSAVPNEWHVMGVTQSAGLSLKWFRDNFCQDYLDIANKMGMDPYVLMDRDAESVPIGSHKLIFLPYLMGERTPHLNGSCRGVFFGLSASHQRSDLIRAVMEGVGYSLNDCYTILKEMGVTAETMLVCGGGGRSQLWRQIMANLYTCPVVTTTSAEGPTFGAAILAGVGIRRFDSVQKACSQLVSIQAPQFPDPLATSSYQPYYRLYRSLYPTLQTAFHSLSEME